MTRRITTALVAAGAMQVIFSQTALAEDRVFEVKLMTPETAMEIAMAAMLDCREKGFQVAVAVVDRGGVTQAVVRDRLAGPHTPDTATRKAWTSVSFRTATTDLAAVTGPETPMSSARQITNALMLGGGIVVEAQGGMLGAIGVSGAPSGEEDELCAQAGLATVAADLEF